MATIDSIQKIPVIVELSGGLEMLFNNQKKIEVRVAEGFTIGDLIKYLCDEVIKDSRKDVFVLGDTVRPGVLVLINDADWELEGELAYVVQAKDSILFVSTLHGG